MTKRIRKPKLRKGKQTADKTQPSSISDDQAGKMFLFWCQNKRNLSLTGREFKVKPTALNRLKRADKWDHRYETKVLPKIRAVFEGKAIDGLTTGLEIIREVRNKIAQRILDSYKVGAKETMPLPTLQELCRVVFTEEYILRGAQPDRAANYNQFGPSLTLIQINSDKTPEQIQERYIELADRLRETGEIEKRRARIDPDGNSSREI